MSKSTSKNYRKFIASAAAMAVVAPMVAPVASLAAANFTDVEGQYVDAVEYLASKGIKGYGNGIFGTHDNITRQDAAVFVAKALGLDTEKAPNAGFTDVAPRAVGAANALKAEGITAGKSATTFGGGDLITRGELAKWIAAAFDLEAGNANNPFSDVEGHYVDAVKALVENEVTSGKTATKFGTHDNATRGQFAVFVYKAAQVDVDGDTAVEGVKAITRTNVSFTIPATTEAVKGFTVEVKDNTGKVVEVNPVDLVKGETEVTLTFKTTLSVDPTGVWTVGGAQFDLDSIKNYNDIVAAVSNSNEVATLAALKKAGLTNIKDGNITEYVTAINASTTKEKLADIQVIVDKTNETSVTAEEAAAAVKAVNEATNQVQLLAALQNKAFTRVNADWIVSYNTSITTAKATPANTDTVAEIQGLIDAVNNTAITTANTAANSVAKQNAVTVLIKNYTAEDVAPITTKAEAIKASEVKSAVFGVKEATTAAAVYNALVKLTELDSTILPTTSLNANLKAEYLTAKTAYGFSTITTAAVKTNIVDAADTAAANAALTAIDGITSTTETADVKVKLQKLANVTSHLGNSKFDMSKVVDSRLVDYRTALAGLTTPSQSNVEAAIASVNAQANEAKNLATIKAATATVVQVRDALTELAAGVETNDTTTAYLNASSQVKLEIAQLVIDNRSDLADSLTVALVTANEETPSYANAVIEAAQAAQVAKVGQFNAIGNLATATNSTTKAKLDTYAYAPYVALTASQKVAVAEEINKLTKPTSATNPTLVALDFSNADAVSTLAQANAYIDAAISKVK